MFLNNSSEKAFGSEPTKSNICPECGEAQVFKWDNEGGGKNIVLTSLSHEDCCNKFWSNIKDFDYEVTIKPSQLKEVA
jgi:hypothetical protein